jgi:hypothetical protein
VDATDDDFTEKELRAAFRRSGLWRDGWTYAKAVATDCVLKGLRIYAGAIRRRQQQNGNPAPQQRALI